MLLTENDWLCLRDSPINRRVNEWTKAGETLLAGEKTYYLCRPANYFRNVFSCILFCPLNQDSVTCSEIPIDLRDCIPELIELWYTLEKKGKETMKKLIKKTAKPAITAKQSTPIITKSLKPAISQVSNGDFQAMVRGIVEALDNRINPVKDTLAGNSQAIAKILTSVADISKALALIIKALDETRSTVVALRKMVESGENEETENEETEKEAKKGRPPAGKMTIENALLEIAAENDVNTDLGESFDDSAFDEIFKLVCEKTDHVHQKAFVKTKARDLKLIS